MYESIRFYQQIQTPSFVATPAGVVFNAATLAWVTAVVANGGTVSVGRETLVNSLIVGLIADGVWTKLDRLWLLAAENQPSALTDLVADSSATAVNSPTFTTDRGYQSDGATNYVETNYNPSPGGFKFLQDDSHFSDWNLTNNVAADRLVTGQTNTLGSGTQWFTGSYYPRINDVGGPDTPAISNGHNLVTRSSNVLRTFYKNGSTGGGLAIGSAAIVNFTFRILGSTDGDFKDSVDQLGAFTAGGGLTGTDALNLYSRLRTYMTAVGVP